MLGADPLDRLIVRPRACRLGSLVGVAGAAKVQRGNTAGRLDGDTEYNYSTSGNLFSVGNSTAD
jgi:hypothetical protein